MVRGVGAGQVSVMGRQVGCRREGGRWRSLDGGSGAGDVLGAPRNRGHGSGRTLEWAGNTRQGVGWPLRLGRLGRGVHGGRCGDGVLAIVKTSVRMWVSCLRSGAGGDYGTAHVMASCGRGMGRRGTTGEAGGECQPD